MALKLERFVTFPCVFTCVTQTLNYVTNEMKCEVQLFLAGQIITETMICRDYQHAREIAIARNPDTHVIGVTAVYPETMETTNDV